MALLPMGVFLWLLLLPPLGHTAPKDGATRPDPEVQPLPNPFHPDQEQLRLLRSYLRGLERMEEEPERMSREQVLLYLFALHDYDQSGQLDGLELLSMLTAALAPQAADSPNTNPVILVVDKVLETQDLDGDGLMTPAELINFPREAPSHTEPSEPLAPAPQEPLLAKGPSRQETQGAGGHQEAAAGQIEGKREPLEPVPEARVVARAEGEVPSPPAGEAGGQVEARNDGEDAREAPRETLAATGTPNVLEAHSIQLENDEM